MKMFTIFNKAAEFVENPVSSFHFTFETEQKFNEM